MSIHYNLILKYLVKGLELFVLRFRRPRRVHRWNVRHASFQALCLSERQQPAWEGRCVAVIRFAPGSVVFRRGGLLLSRSFIAPGLGAVFLGILHLGDNLASLAARVMVVGMRRRLQLGTTFSACK